MRVIRPLDQGGWFMSETLRYYGWKTKEGGAPVPMNAGSEKVPVGVPGTISQVVRPCPSVPRSPTLNGWESKPGMNSDVSARTTGKPVLK